MIWIVTHHWPVNLGDDIVDEVEADHPSDAVKAACKTQVDAARTRGYGKLKITVELKDV